MKIGIFRTALTLSKLFGMWTFLVFFGVAPSHATIVYVTYTGTVSSGGDDIGIFGLPGANLAGSAFTTNYVFDVTFGPNHSSFQSPTLNYVEGGTSFGPPYESPLLGATLKVGLVTVSVSGEFIAGIYGRCCDGFQGFTQQYHFALDGLTYLENLVVNYDGPLSQIPASITSPFFYVVKPNDGSDGIFCTPGLTFVDGDPPRGPCIGLRATSLLVSLSPPAVPLPATLPLFLTGLGALGLIGWRRKRKQAA